MNRQTLAWSMWAFARVLQFGLAAFGVLFAVSPFLGNADVFTGLAMLVFALVLFAVVGVVEFLAVRPLERRKGE